MKFVRYRIFFVQYLERQITASLSPPFPPASGHVCLTSAPLSRRSSAPRSPRRAATRASRGLAPPCNAHAHPSPPTRSGPSTSAFPWTPGFRQAQMYTRRPGPGAEFSVARHGPFRALARRGSERKRPRGRKGPLSRLCGAGSVGRGRVGAATPIRMHVARFGGPTCSVCSRARPGPARSTE